MIILAVTLLILAHAFVGSRVVRSLHRANRVMDKQIELIQEQTKLLDSQSELLRSQARILGQHSDIIDALKAGKPPTIQ